MTKPVAAGRSLYLHSNSLRRYLCGFGSRGLASSSRGGEGIVGIKKQRVDEKDRHEFLDSTLRSSHAAEIGMNSFLEGQRFIENAHSLCFRGQSRDSSSSAVDRRDFASSNVDEFQRWISERRIRPSLVQPFFHLGGFALGAISTLGGNHTASLVRSAIRDSVSTSYNDRIRDAVEKGFGDDRSLINFLKDNRDQAVNSSASSRDAPADERLSGEKHPSRNIETFIFSAIKFGCGVGIRIAQKL